MSLLLFLETPPGAEGCGGAGGVGSVLLVETLPILTCNIMILDWKPPSRACFAAVLGSIMVD